MGFKTCCLSFFQFKARRAAFYAQVVVSATVMGLSCYIFIDRNDEIVFRNIATPLFNFVLFYWLPSPEMIRKNKNKIICDACNFASRMASMNSKNPQSIIFPKWIPLPEPVKKKMSTEIFCLKLFKLKARRANFYVQLVVTLTGLAIGCFLLITNPNSESLTIGLNLISSITGYWLPSPRMERKDTNERPCPCCEQVHWVVMPISPDGHIIEIPNYIFPEAYHRSTATNDTLTDPELVSGHDGLGPVQMEMSPDDSPV